MPVDPNIPRSLNPDAALAERLAALELEVRNLVKLTNGGASQQIPVVDALPTFGREGRLVKLRAGSVYVDTGSGWAAL